MGLNLLLLGFSRTSSSFADVLDLQFHLPRSHAPFLFRSFRFWVSLVQSMLLLAVVSYHQCHLLDFVSRFSLSDILLGCVDVAGLIHLSVRRWYRRRACSPSALHAINTKQLTKIPSLGS